MILKTTIYYLCRKLNHNNYNCVACDVAYYGVFLINKGCKKNTLLIV